MNYGLNYYLDIILLFCHVDCSCEALWVGSCLTECHLHTGTYVLYCIVLGKHPYPCKHPAPNFDSIVVSRVLCVTAHHANFLCSESEGKSAELTTCDCSDALWVPQHQISKVRTTPSVASFAAFFPCSTKFMYCKRRLNAAETYQQGYESIHFVAQYNFLYYRTGLNESRTNQQCKSIWSHGY